MRRTARDSDFTPTPVQSLVLAVVDKGLDWKEVDTLLEQLEKAGSLDTAITWDDRGNGLLGALLAIQRSQYDKTPPESVLDRCLRLDPQTFTRKNLSGDTAVALFLDHYANKESSAARQLPWMIEHAPKEAFLRWTPQDNYGERTRFIAPGMSLFQYLLHVEHDNYRASAETQLGLILDLGISPNVRDQEKHPTACSITSIQQWDVFLKAGGDPLQTFRDNADEPASPKITLWEHLVNRSSSELEKVVRAWAAKNVGGDIAAKDLADYWAALEKSANGSISPADISPRLRSHPDWLTLRDDHGRTPAMYGIRMHGSAWRTLEQKRMAPMLQERDNLGRNLWHYALSRGPQMGSDTVKFLKNAKVSADPSPVTGRGLIAGLYLAPELQEGFRPGEILSRNSDVTKTLIKHTTAAQCWTMPEEDVAPLIDVLLDKAFSEKRYHPFDTINDLLKAHAPELTDPHLLGLAVLFNLGGYQPDKELLRDCFARGAVFTLSEAHLEQLREMAQHDLYDEALRLNEHNLLAQSTPASPTRRPGPRL